MNYLVKSIERSLREDFVLPVALVAVMYFEVRNF